MVMLTSYEDLLIQPPLWRAPPALGLFLVPPATLLIDPEPCTATHVYVRTLQLAM